MSAEGLTAAQEIDGTPLDQLLAIKLGLVADDDGIAWPSQELLARKCNVSVRAINRSLARLEEMGFLQIVNVQVAVNVHKELMGDKKPRREFLAWCKGADKRSVCYVLNLGRFKWRDRKQQDSLSINSGDMESPIVGEVMDSNDQTDGQRVHLINNKNKNNNNTDDDAPVSSPVGSAGKGQPTGSPEDRDIKPEMPRQNAHWKANAERIRSSLLYADFEISERMSVISDDGFVLVLAWPGPTPQVPQSKADEVVCKLAAILDRRIDLAVTPWADAAARQRRAKRLGLKLRKDNAA